MTWDVAACADGHSPLAKREQGLLLLAPAKRGLGETCCCEPEDFNSWTL